jgi:transcriptional regulator with XRE-family HTH domain
MRTVTPEEIDQLIAGNVRAVRARLRMRQEDLADKMSWSRPTVTSLEAGTRRVTVSDAILLCQALEVDLAELLRSAPGDVTRTLRLQTHQDEQTARDRRTSPARLRGHEGTELILRLHRSGLPRRDAPQQPTHPSKPYRLRIAAPGRRRGAPGDHATASLGRGVVPAAPVSVAA